MFNGLLIAFSFQAFGGQIVSSAQLQGRTVLDGCKGNYVLNNSLGVSLFGAFYCSLAAFC